MALNGKPAIPTPRGLDAKVIEQAVNNIRERLAKADAEINALRGLAEGSTSAQAIAQLQRQIAQITQQINVISAGSSGVTFNEFTMDLGAGRSSGSFDLAIFTGLTVGKVVQVIQTASPIAAKGDARDEAEMDSIIAVGYVHSPTTIRVFWRATGVVVGPYNFAYLVSA